jgi:hypothetical protein
MAYFIFIFVDENCDGSLFELLAFSCLDWNVDNIHRLCEALYYTLFFTSSCSSYAGCLLYMGLNDFMERLINESGNTYV